MEFLLVINYWAVLVAGIAFWLLGSLWFTLLFGGKWARLIQAHGIKIKEPTKKEMVSKFIGTFILNLVVALGVAILIYALNITTITPAIILGLILGICFTFAPFLVSYTWENRSVALSLIDIGYPVIGIIISAIILALWR